MPEETKPIIDWEPAPGSVLVKPVKREELAALYNRGGSNLSLPDKVGKVSDSVGVGRVIKLGAPARVLDASEAISQQEAQQLYHASQLGLQVGDYIAYMPYTDLLIEIDGVKYALVEYKNIRAVRKA